MLPDSGNGRKWLSHISVLTDGQIFEETKKKNNTRESEANYFFNSYRTIEGTGYNDLRPCFMKNYQYACYTMSSHASIEIAASRLS